MQFFSCLSSFKIILNQTQWVSFLLTQSTTLLTASLLNRNLTKTDKQSQR